MGKIQPAYELAWFLCVMGSSGNQASTRLSESGSGFRAICTLKFKGAHYLPQGSLHCIPLSFSYGNDLIWRNWNLPAPLTVYFNCILTIVKEKNA
uniref:Uncharacterized protein n=1 Tax=Magallana gigas TaxID=29159 RepID=K1P7P0_MAGGI